MASKSYESIADLNQRPVQYFFCLLLLLLLLFNEYRNIFTILVGWELDRFFKHMHYCRTGKGQTVTFVLEIPSEVSFRVKGDIQRRDICIR